MFLGRQYKRVSQQGDTDSDTTDNETAFFTSENGSRKWRMGMSPGNLNQDPELDLPYIHPTLPVETKKNKLSGHHTCRQVISGVCLLLVILAMVAAFTATIILGQKFIIEAPPTDNHNLLLVTPQTSDIIIRPAPTTLVSTEGSELISNEDRAPIRQDCTRCTSTVVAMITSSPSIPYPTPMSTITIFSTVQIHSSSLEPAATTERTNIASNNIMEEGNLKPSPQSAEEDSTTFMYTIEEERAKSAYMHPWPCFNC